MAKKRANGEGNIRKRSDGRWEGRYTAGYNSETGKHIIKNVLGKTQAECKAKLAAAMEATKGVDVSRADEYTVATWLRSWYDIYAKPNVRVATADRYRLMIEQYTIPRIGSIKLTKLTAHDLQKLYKELMESGRTNRKSGHGNPGLSSTTVRSLHLMLHNALNRAVKERLILRNPTEDCIAPKVQKFAMQILQPEHIKTYLDAADKRGLLPMFYLELVSGLRKGELTALLWSDLDIQNKTISVSKQYVKNPNGELTLSRPKTETSVRKVSIPQEAVDLLVAEHKKHPDNPYMFPSPVTGEMYYPDSIVNQHKKILKDAGLPHIRFHDLRHPYVKHTTKIFSLRLKFFQAQPVPDALRKTRGAFLLFGEVGPITLFSEPAIKSDRAGFTSVQGYQAYGCYCASTSLKQNSLPTHTLTHRLNWSKSKEKVLLSIESRTFWSCWADSNRRPHPYQWNRRLEIALP